MDIKASFLVTIVSAFIMATPALAGPVMAIQVYNNLYNQNATSSVSGMTPSTITADFYNGATKCDSVTVTFRGLISELVGTGSNQKCATVSSVKLIAGTSSVYSGLQVYSATPVTVSLDTTAFEHSIIVQDLGTGVTGTPASDGSIAPIFNTTNGTVSTQGTLGYLIKESKLW